MHMKIDIIVDTICPWCYIGKKRFDRALREGKREYLEVGWRAFFLNRDMPTEGMNRNSYIFEKFGGLEAARSVHKTLKEAGHEEGINFNFSKIERTPNTLNSHRLVRHAAKFGIQTEIISAIFEGYFHNGEDIGEVEVLARLAEGQGLDHTETIQFLESDREKEEVLSEDELARRLGVNGVPCFIIDRKYVISGAQPPEVLGKVFNLAEQEGLEIRNGNQA